MSTLQEKELVLKFKFAGYDLDTSDYRVLKTKLWLLIGDTIKTEGYLMHDFEFILNDKKAIK